MKFSSTAYTIDKDEAEKLQVRIAYTAQNHIDRSVWFVSVVVIGLAIGLYIYYREMRSLNKAIKDIDEYVNGN